MQWMKNMKQQNKNFIFNASYQLIIYLFPLFTAAYVSRVLGPEKLGIHSYVNSIVSIFGMFGMLGISNYGNREVAKVRDDRRKLSSVFSSIYTLQLILSIVVFVIYVTIILTFPLSNKSIFYIHMLNIAAIGSNITWLFFGLEKFKVTLLRDLLVKFASMFLIFLFVKTQADLWIYSLVMSFSTLISQVFLLLLAQKEVDFSLTSFNKAMKHLRSCIILFIPIIAFSIYRIMDKILIGALSTKSQLGYYENADRIISIPIMIISSLGTVMMPYMSHIIHNKNENYQKIIYSSMKIALSIAVYSTLGLMLVGKDLVIIMFGSEYTQSGFLIMILAPTIIASAWANVVRTQYLIPKSLDKIYVYSTFIGAIINLVFNLFFISRYGAIGACIGTVLAEYSIPIYQTFHVRKALDVRVFINILLIFILKASVVMLVIYTVGLFVNNIYLKLVLQIIIAVFLFIVQNKKFIFIEFLGRN